METPAARQRHSAEHRQHFVAAVKRTVKTYVACFPHAVDRSNAVWFAEDFFEVDLQGHIGSHVKDATRPISKELNIALMR